MNIDEIINNIANKLKEKLPKIWIGKEAILFMKNNNCNHLKNPKIRIIRIPF